MMKMNDKIANRKLGLYFHIPFCKERCSYCDFLTFPHVEKYHEPYIESLIKEMKLWQEKGISRNFIIDSLYIGGGTPTLLSLEQLGKLLVEINKIFNIEKGSEWTIEANPGTLSREKIDLLIEMGVNRISLGVQTLSEDLIKFCKRPQSEDMVYRDAKLIKEYQDLNLNLDFIFSIPGQTEKDLEKDLSAIKSINPDHVSYYSLIIEDKTLLNYWINKGIVLPNSEEKELKLMKLAYQGLKNLGYRRYEISNFSKKGKESIHNLKYWSCEEYLGLGIGAASYINGVRFSNIRSIQKYIKSMSQNELAFKKEERSTDDDIFERLMLGFRKIDGIDRAKFKEETGEDPLYRAFDFFLEEKSMGIVDWDDAHVYLTDKGLDLQSSFLVSLLEYF